MRNKGPKALAVAALVVAILLVVIVFRSGWRDHSPPSPIPPPPMTGTSGSAPDTRPGTLSDAPSKTSAIPAPAPGESLPPPMLQIRGRVLGPTPGRGGRTRIEIVPVGWRIGHGIEPVVTEAEEGGSFSIDVSSLFAGDSRPAELEVRADHSEFVPASRRVAVDETVARREKEASLEVEIVLVLAGIVTGEIRDEAGQPLAGAAVSIHPMEKGRPRKSPLDSTSTGPEGRYRLRGRANAPHLVAAAREDLVPDAAMVTATSGQETLVRPLVLAPGATVSGRVTMGGEPVEGARVVGWAENRASRLIVGRQALTWSEEGVALRKVVATTDSQGRYRFAGLCPGPLRVKIDDIPGESLSAALERGLEIMIDAPADDADIEVAGAHLSVTVRSETGPLGRISVLIFQGGTIHHKMTNEQGRLTLLAQPNETLNIVVEEKGYEAFSRELLMSGPGTERLEVVDLEKKRPRPTLVVVLETPEGLPVEHAGFGFFEVGATRDFPKFHRDVQATEGRFRIGDLVPGTWRVVVRAGGAWFGGRGYWIEAETTVVLPAAGEIEARIPLRRGGRLRIVAKGEDDAHLPAWCEIRPRSGGGPPLPVHFATRSPGGYSEGGPPLDAGRPSEVATALPPGNYVVDLWLDGYVRETRDVEIEAGKTAEVAVTLRRR